MEGGLLRRGRDPRPDVTGKRAAGGEWRVSRGQKAQEPLFVTTERRARTPLCGHAHDANFDSE